jgi:hypothetical protein
MVGIATMAANDRHDFPFPAIAESTPFLSDSGFR